MQKYVLKRPLMPTPAVYALGIMQPFADTLPAELKTVDVNIMYATDRVPEPRKDGRLDYGMGRDHTLDLVLTVRYGHPPGAENGRPLEHIEGLFWKIDDDLLC